MTLEDIKYVLMVIDDAYILGSNEGFAYLKMHSDHSGFIGRDHLNSHEITRIAEFYDIRTRDDLYNAVCQWFYGD